MNRSTFFAEIRPAFGALNTAQVEGMEALLDAGAGLPLHHMANILAQVRRETGGYMSPIKETVMPHHKNKNPSDAEVIRRLDNAFAAGKLKWVKTPYWRDGWFGRGQIQLTHRANYLKFGITNPENAMHLAVSAKVAVRGMVEGMFTRRKLADYDFPAAIDAPPAQNPRRIVNGQDGSDREIARFHRDFANALAAAGWSVSPPKPPVSAPKPPAAPTPAPASTGTLARLWAALVAWRGKKG